MKHQLNGFPVEGGHEGGQVSSWPLGKIKDHFFNLAKAKLRVKNEDLSPIKLSSKTT